MIRIDNKDIKITRVQRDMQKREETYNRLSFQHYPMNESGKVLLRRSLLKELLAIFFLRNDNTYSSEAIFVQFLLMCQSAQGWQTL